MFSLENFRYPIVQLDKREMVNHLWYYNSRHKDLVVPDNLVHIPNYHRKDPEFYSFPSDNNCHICINHNTYCYNIYKNDNNLHNH